MNTYHELIDRVFSGHCGLDLTIMAQSEEEWRKKEESRQAEVQATSAKEQREAWVQNVVELFGEDRVTIIDE